MYNGILLEHSRNPKFKGLRNANKILEKNNIACGDNVRLMIDIENNIIKNISFASDGCAICQASADIMCGLVIGKTVEEAKEMANRFKEIAKGNPKEDMGEANAFEDLKNMPGRVNCAYLGWSAIEEM